MAKPAIAYIVAPAELIALSLVHHYSAVTEKSLL